ncbi:MAG: hypothetical protein CM15mP46_7310 [Alphaproteobacteria bacterium]|nr:MAG: hypothetical protein CM15mP46_7310 [Alphaproteobacteria bacterium]
MQGRRTSPISGGPFGHGHQQILGRHNGFMRGPSRAGHRVNLKGIFFPGGHHDQIAFYSAGDSWDEGRTLGKPISINSFVVLMRDAMQADLLFWAPIGIGGIATFAGIIMQGRVLTI